MQKHGEARWRRVAARAPPSRNLNRQPEPCLALVWMLRMLMRGSGPGVMCKEPEEELVYDRMFEGARRALITLDDSLPEPDRRGIRPVTDLLTCLKLGGPKPKLCLGQGCTAAQAPLTGGRDVQRPFAFRSRPAPGCRCWLDR